MMSTLPNFSTLYDSTLNFGDTYLTQNELHLTNNPSLLEDLEQTVVNQIVDDQWQELYPCHRWQSLHDSLESFRNRGIENWTSDDCFEWALAVCRAENLPYENCKNFHVFRCVTGKQLLSWNLGDFSANVDSEYGPVFYNKIREEGQSMLASGLQYTTLKNMVEPIESTHNEGSLFSHNVSSVPSNNEEFQDYRCNDYFSTLKNIETLDSSYYSCSDDIDTMLQNYESAMTYPFDEESQKYRSENFLDTSFENSLDNSSSDFAEEFYQRSSSSSPYGYDTNPNSPPGLMSNVLEPRIEKLNLDEIWQPASDVAEIAQESWPMKVEQVELKDDIINSSHWFQKIPSGGLRKSRYRNPKIWEFIIRLLQDPRTNPQFVRWEDEARGTFRLMQKEKISAAWGRRKGSDGHSLPYESVARLLRHYYKKNILLQVREKQMVYQFGPEIMKQISQGYKW